tara:strand:+ start:503 stop:967 length:465 start_codon:yes stop_codon:yes gene_type:complete
MNNIEELCNYDIKIIKKKLIYRITIKDVVYTELKLVSALQKLRDFLNTISNDNIKKMYFIFDFRKLKIPSNFLLFKEIANCFISNQKVIIEKLEFSIIISSNKIFKLFFGLLKQYYSPLKPLYLCSNDEDCENCLFNSDYRKKVINLSNNIKNE